MRAVKVKVTSLDQVKTMSEESAKRLVKINPAEYRILEPPKVEVINLPPLPEKKSVVVAESEPKQEVVVAEEVVEDKPKIGRPKKQA